jgi:transcriptional regulator with XRE-family HTH domain
VAYDDELPTKLRMERARVKLTQAQVASQTGLTPSMLCNYENGERTPTLQSLKALAGFYGVSIDYLVGRR